MTQSVAFMARYCKDAKFAVITLRNIRSVLRSRGQRLVKRGQSLWLRCLWRFKALSSAAKSGNHGNAQASKQNGMKKKKVFRYWAIYQQQINGKIITSKHDKVDQNSCFQLRKQVLGSFCLQKHQFNQYSCSCWSCGVLGADVSFSKRCPCADLLQTNVVGRAGTGTSGIPPLTDLIVRRQKLLGGIRNKVTSAVFRAGSNWGSLRLSQTCLQDPPFPPPAALNNLIIW